MRFREKALAKLQAPDELDVPARLARPQSWIALAVVAAVVVSGGIWAAVGTLPRTVRASGILTHLQGSFSLQSPVAGQITGVFVSQGNTFPQGTPMFTVQAGDRTEIIRSVTGGRVTAMLGKVGQVIAAGSDLAVIERVEDQADGLVAVLYVPAGEAGLIRKDSTVDLSVQSAPAQEFGVLRGTVQSVGQFAESRQQISDFLGDDQLGERFTSLGQPLKVVVRLTDGETASGYRWSTQNGPPYRIDSRTLVTGAVHLSSVKPIDWVVL
ncbi:HlyD family efflux transporter periplasmic adaptor subunit [Lentzea tibetensis]|uniref:HlyD family efflux transporter periplasmic adaptor subunit n=1 Tax=Lentzea tibetensis TaxID=2591470 RepID=A0A563ESA5_9PSEU|nr:HlyD family efflux transporter periplasmic adaptor subunit [Lentzea tibetensis]TWP50482.1 HlyD family efflux transporter periplasmic adaptor subunit [Lentzea tibetensis]